MKRFGGLFVALLVASLLTGCMATSAGVAPSTTPIAGRDYTVIGESVGSGWAFNLLGIPLQAGNSTYRAREAALAKTGADALINASVDNVMYNFFLIAAYRTKVSGEAIKFVE